MRMSLQDRVYRAIVSKRRMLALSVIANVVLLALLAFKFAPQPQIRRYLMATIGTWSPNSCHKHMPSL